MNSILKTCGCASKMQMLGESLPACADILEAVARRKTLNTYVQDEEEMDTQQKYDFHFVSTMGREAVLEEERFQFEEWVSSNCFTCGSHEKDPMGDACDFCHRSLGGHEPEVEGEELTERLIEDALKEDAKRLLFIAAAKVTTKKTTRRKERMTDAQRIYNVVFKMKSIGTAKKGAAVKQAEKAKFFGVMMEAEVEEVKRIARDRDMGIEDVANEILCVIESRWVIK